MKTPRLTARVGLLVASFLGLGPAADAKVVFVAKTGSDANNGLSWATAKATVQAGLSAAVAGDEVWVAAGTYVERITLTAEAALYGGFTGGEADRVQRDWKGERHHLGRECRRQRGHLAHRCNARHANRWLHHPQR